MREQTYVVPEEYNEMRIDKLLNEKRITSSRSQIQNWIKEGYVRVNGKIVKANYKCAPQDLITWNGPVIDEVKLIPANIPLDIIYEDDDIIIVNKVSGMVVHPASGHSENTLVHALLYHTEKLSSLGGIERPGIIHRLDKDTSGILVVAKTDIAHESLSKQLLERSMERLYIAIVHGVITHESGLVDAPIGRNPSDRKKMAVVPGGKEAKTHFQVLERFNHYTLVQCRLETGRTHQIRVHMKYIEHPVLGDETYAPRQTSKIKSQALHAQTLRFIHPRTKEEMTFHAEIPEDLQTAIEKVRQTY